jgi:hypothetical protein
LRGWVYHNGFHHDLNETFLVVLTRLSR